MSTVEQAAEALVTALQGVEGVRYYADPAAAIDPPATVLSLPALQWEGIGREPTTATFVVYVIAAMDARAIGRLWGYVELVSAAVEKVTDAAVLRADPNAYGGNTNLPCYELTIEMSI